MDGRARSGGDEALWAVDDWSSGVSSAVHSTSVLTS